MPAQRITASAPGRLCLFGEHQDFLGLPVIALAVTRDITFSGVRRDDAIFDIHLPGKMGGDLLDDVAHQRQMVEDQLFLKGFPALPGIRFVGPCPQGFGGNRPRIAGCAIWRARIAALLDVTGAHACHCASPCHVMIRS